MAIISLKCNNCGNAINAAEGRASIVCESCGTRNVIVPDTITNNTYQTIHKTVIGRGGDEAEECIARGNTFMSLDEPEKALKAFQMATDINPANHLGWLGMAAVLTENFQFSPVTALFPDPARGYVDYIKKAIKVAPEASRDEIKALLDRTELEIARYKRLLAEEGDMEKFKNSEVFSVGGFHFRDLVLIRYDGDDADVVIPETYSAIQSPPKSIGNGAFAGNTKIRTVTIPGTVTYIGNRAFAGCTNMASFTVPPQVVLLGGDVFAGWGRKQKVVISKGQIKSFAKKQKKLGIRWDGNTKAKIVKVAPAPVV